MKSIIRLGFALLTIQLFVFTAEARNEEESFLMLREAMMESNADYNKHKKKANHEEMDRAETWGKRGSQMIVINGRHVSSDDVQEYQAEELEYDESNGREISSNDIQNEEEVTIQD